MGCVGTMPCACPRPSEDEVLSPMHLIPMGAT